MKLEKSSYFQKFPCIALQKFQALRQFQTLRLSDLDIFFQTLLRLFPNFIREIRVKDKPMHLCYKKRKADSEFPNPSKQTPDDVINWWWTKNTHRDPYRDDTQ